MLQTDQETAVGSLRGCDYAGIVNRAERRCTIGTVSASPSDGYWDRMP